MSGDAIESSTNLTKGVQRNEVLIGGDCAGSGPDLAVTELTAASLLNRIRFNNDAGSQYTSVAYTDRIDELGVCALIGTVGDSAVCCCGPRGLNVVSKAME